MFQPLKLMVICCWLNQNLVAVFGHIGSAVHPVLQFSKKGEPGMKMRVTQKGFDYVNDLAAKAMGKILSEMEIPDLDRDFGLQGRLILERIKIVAYKPADKFEVILSPPGLNSHIAGRYVYGLLPLDINGDMELAAIGICFSVTSGLDLSPENGAKATTLNCQANITHMDVNIQNGGLVGGLINIFKGLALPTFTSMLEKELCGMATVFTDDKVNEKLATFPTKISLDQAKDLSLLRPMQERIKNASESSTYAHPVRLGGWIRHERDIVGSLSDSIKKGLMLDYSLLEKPTVTHSHIETINHGEVSWQGRGRTPFYPEPMIEPLFVPAKMFYVLTSDYLPNSLLYHAYRRGLLRLRVTPDNEEFGSFLKTTCFDAFLDFCLGDILPPIQEHFPDEDLELLFHPSRAPAMVFNQRGTVGLDIQGMLFLFLHRGEAARKQILSAAIDMVADTKLHVQNKTVIGEVKLERFTISPQGNNLDGVDAALLDQFAIIVGGILESEVNDILSKGLPIPVIQGLKLKDPDLVIMDRYVIIETDIEVEQKAIEFLAGDALRQFDFAQVKS